MDFLMEIANVSLLEMSSKASWNAHSDAATLHFITSSEAIPIWLWYLQSLKCCFAPGGGSRQVQSCLGH